MKLYERLRQAVKTRFQLAIYDEDGRHSVKNDVLQAADILEKLDHAITDKIAVGIDFGKGAETVMVTVKDGKIVDSTVCNGGDCERKSLGAEPCPGCQHYDEKGDL